MHACKKSKNVFCFHLLLQSLMYRIFKLSEQFMQCVFFSQLSTVFISKDDNFIGSTRVNARLFKANEISHGDILYISGTFKEFPDLWSCVYSKYPVSWKLLEFPRVSIGKKKKFIIGTEKFTTFDANFWLYLYKKEKRFYKKNIRWENIE